MNKEIEEYWDKVANNWVENFELEYQKHKKESDKK